MKVVLNKVVLINYMNEHNENVYSLAKRMEVSPSTIYRLLNGERSVGSNLIVKILKAFNLYEQDFEEFFCFMNNNR